MVAATRLLLAILAVLIISLDPFTHRHPTVATSLVLGLSIVYGMVLSILTLRDSRYLASINNWAHWVDAGWYATLIALGHSTSGIFTFFFFPILVAAFRSGLTSALRVATASAVFATVIGLATAFSAPDFELNRLLLQPVSLLVLGFMLAYRGEFELTLKRQLALLKEVTRLSNPRFGVDQTIGSIMARLRAFYEADSCLLVLREPATDTFHLRRADDRNPAGGARTEPVPAALAQRLLALPTNLAIVHTGTSRAWWRLPVGGRRQGCDVATGVRTAESREVSATVAELLDVESFVTVPFRSRDEAVGRLYLTAQRPRAFDDLDGDFLRQVVEHVAPVIDSVCLVDQLASSAAEEERRRIARDLHDSVLQPYIGLHMGLVATRQKLASGGDVMGDLDWLIAMTSIEIADLRNFAQGLTASAGCEDSLLPAVRRFAGRFSAATHIKVHVEAAGDLRINDRLAAQAFQIVAEGLSNVRRHTQAPRAMVRLGRENGHLILRIEDEGANGASPAPFTPRSITERAAALGGRAHVERREDGGSAVVVEIPL
ncbi:MAG TPA: hypothetical protein DEP84_09410 [Chloroflexi bacterium]|nr:hypothetical protein [Chloroflexota bacterium]